MTPAHEAVEIRDVAVLTRLLDGGASPDESWAGMTLLTHAIDSEADGANQTGIPHSTEITAVLLAYGADPALADPSGWVPSDFARFYRHEMAVRLLDVHISSRGTR